MRARWVSLIVAGVLVVVLARLLLRPPPTGQLGVQLLGRTNNIQTLLITNGTPHVYQAGALAETTQDLYCISVRLRAHESLVIPVLLSTNIPRRIVFTYGRDTKSTWESWCDAAAAHMGAKRRYLERMYIDVPD
jgi:hypothetical protein